jgi:hypothetical protein
MRLKTIPVLVFSLYLGLLGCSRPPGLGKSGPGTKSSTPEDSLQTALAAFPKAAALADYKDALHLLNKYLTKQENQEAVKFSAEDRKALAGRFGLQKEELEATEANTFRTLDAHYLEWCFLVRDTARALDRNGLDPLEQARTYLAWVDRQVLLRESAGDVLPPLYALRAGQGTARERALVFLALLQQARIPACVLLWPDSEPGKPKSLLVGVLDTRRKPADIYLFDPRLGLPVPGPEGIATLAQTRKDPKLVPFAGIKSTVRPEILVACPLSALAPRMKFLEDKLGRSDKIVLAIEPARLLKQITAAAASDVGVWSLSLRMMPAFLPPPEGGTDALGRLSKFEAQRIPLMAVVQNYTAMGLMGKEMPVEQAQFLLMKFAQQLFIEYVDKPHALMLKSQLDKANKKLQIMRSVLEDLEFAPPQNLNKMISAWREQVRIRYLAVVRARQESPGSPREAAAQEAAEAFWYKDRYLMTLLNGENPDTQKHAKEELSNIVLTAVKDPLGEQVHYLLAGVWQEKAERSQASWERVQKTGKSEAQVRRALEKKNEAWTDVCGWWQKYEARYPLAWSSLEPRFQIIPIFWKKAQQEKALSQWDNFLGEVHRTAAAPYFLAQAHLRLGQAKEARKRLVKLEGDLTSLLQNADIQKELTSAKETVKEQGNPIQAAIVENLARDLGPDGGFFLLREKVRRQVQGLKLGK